MKKTLSIIGIIAAFLVIPFIAPAFVIVYINKGKLNRGENKMSSGKAVLSYLGMLTGYLALGFVIMIAVGLDSGNSASESVDVARNGASTTTISSSEKIVDNETANANNVSDYNNDVVVKDTKAEDNVSEEEALMEAREAAMQMYEEQAASDSFEYNATATTSNINNNVVYIDECIVTRFHEIYEKYVPKSGETFSDYFVRAYGDMLTDAYDAGQQGDAYDPFAGNHNDIKIGKETKASGSYDYNSFVNGTNDFVSLRMEVNVCYKNNYILLPETDTKYVYDMDNPYIGYFASNPVSVTNVSEYDARHLLTEMEPGQKVIIVGKLNGTKKIDGQEFPIIEIHLARTASASEDLAEMNGTQDARANFTNGSNGYVVVRSDAGNEYSEVKQVKNGVQLYTYESKTATDGSEWYNVAIYDKLGTVYGWISASDIEERYIH